MKQFVTALGVVLIAVVLCMQTVLAYEFVGAEVDIENTESFSFPSFAKFIWSPDGENILYQSNGILYEMNVDDGLTEELYHFGANPDLQYYLLSKMRLTPDGTGVIMGSSSQKIFTLDVNTLDTTILVDSGAYPTLSPDGRYLLYTDFSTGTAVLYDTIADEREDFGFPDSPDPGFAPFSAVFGPNSEYIYFCQLYDPESEGESGQYAIARIPVQGGETEILSDRFEGYACSMSFSYYGNMILYNDGADALALDLTTGEVKNVLTNEAHTGKRELGSGQWIVTDDDDNIIEYEIDGVEADPETDMIFRYCMQAFSPDGTQLVYYVDTAAPNYQKAYLVDIDLSFYPEADYSDLPMAVDDNQPEAFATLSNFPNPFNPSTTIEFTVPEAGNAKLVVYDITGRKVRELADGFYTAGSHAIQWNACDDMGKPVSSGMYMARLTSGNAVVNSRMTLVR